MSFNKEKSLMANIEAIKLTFQLEKEHRSPTEEEVKLLKDYAGFGALKCVLNPAGSLSDIAHWTKSEIELFPLVAELHQVLKDNSKSEKEYKQYFNSLKNSVLTSFYTPAGVVQTIAKSFQDNEINPNRFLDPSAGMGVFISAFKEQGKARKIIGFEKDLLTGKMLSHLYSDDNIKIKGFEEIENRYNNYFDFVSSNIPFGDMAVFDVSFVKSKDKVKQLSARNIHNYFFIKAIDTLREGGIMAFITSQGVMNSQKNEPVRQWLMKNTNLVSAIRLPNNLFTDYAGTEVGSDLIVLQKNSNKQDLHPKEKEFIKSYVSSSGIPGNEYYQDTKRIVHTQGYHDTDPYGKKAWIYLHEGGIYSIATDLKKMLHADINTNLNFKLYQQNSLKSKLIRATEKKSTQNQSTTTEQPIVTLYDLFGFSEQERRQVSGKQKRRKPPPKKSRQQNLFSSDLKGVVSKPQKKSPSLEIRNFDGVLKSFYKKGSFVRDDGQIGFLKEYNEDEATFKPLELNPIQQSKADLYIHIRDTYHQLYTYEAKELSENKEKRKSLNTLYDDFVNKYGQLNDTKNLGLIKMDRGASEILALERAINGQLVKADIFYYPVAFNPDEFTQVQSSEEALAASLNRFGEVDTGFMLSLLEGKSREELIQELHGRIYFNPLVQNHEVAGRFIAGGTIKTHSLQS
jgi:hypothetical protein